jgi:hypothetical protein
MGRYWSLEDCCWVEYSSSMTERPATSAVEPESAVTGGPEQIPEQPTATPQQAPSLT